MGLFVVSRPGRVFSEIQPSSLNDFIRASGLLCDRILLLRRRLCLSRKIKKEKEIPYVFMPSHFGSEDLLIFVTRLHCDVPQFVHLKVSASKIT